MSDLKDFVIENGVLTKYVGQGGDVVIPDGVTMIDDWAFYQKGVKSVVIPNSVTIIGRSAFKWNPLDKVEYLGTIEQWVEINFAYNSDIFGDRNGLYINNQLVTEVNLTSATKISAHAFRGYNRLKSVTIPSSVTSIGEGAFNSCNGLTSVVILDGVTRIGGLAFFCCERLKNITIPSSVRSIDSNAFYGCRNLTKIKYLGTIDQWEKIESIRDSHLLKNDTCGLYIGNKLVEKATLTIETRMDKYTFSGYKGLKDVIISYGITKIEDNLFTDCGGLTKIEIPNSVTSIGCAAFYNCYNLTNITIPNSVRSIGSNAFYGCNELKNIEIPNSVTSIADDVVSSCKKLEKIKMHEELIKKSAFKMFGNNGKTIEAEVITKSGKLLKTVLVVRREYWTQMWNYEKDYLLPLGEESAMHYDMLVASGEYEGFKMKDNLRLKAMLYRLQADEYPVNEEMKQIFIYYMAEHINDIIKLSEKEMNALYLLTAINAGCVTEENKEDVLKKLKKSKNEEIKALADLIV